MKRAKRLGSPHAYAVSYWVKGNETSMKWEFRSKILFKRKGYPENTITVSQEPCVVCDLKMTECKTSVTVYKR